MKSIIEVNEFNFQYGSKKVLEDVSFHVEEGELIGLLGENGSGKTTLLDCLYGFHGEMKSIKVFDTTPMIDSQIMKAKVSYIQDSPNLLNYLTAQQYLSFICKIEKLNYQEKIEEIMQLIKLFNLEEEFDRKLLKDYSFGMKKKIQMIGEFFLHKPFMIIDEPTNGLDVRMIILLKDLIRKE